MLRQARAFSSFPASMEPPDGDAAVLPQFRVAPVAPPMSEGRPDWMSDTDEPNIYMTFGTVVGSFDKGKAFIRAALDAVGSLKLRALMTTGGTVDVTAIGAIPENVVLREFVPQNAVFPHVSAVLCHGGSGSVLGALAAGLPLVVTPVSADQPENAVSVAACGAGLAVDTPKANILAEEVQKVLMNPAYATAARQVATEMVAQASLEEAVVEMLRQTSTTKD